MHILNRQNKISQLLNNYSVLIKMYLSNLLNIETKERKSTITATVVFFKFDRVKGVV